MTSPLRKNTFGGDGGLSLGYVLSPLRGWGGEARRPGRAAFLGLTPPGYVLSPLRGWGTHFVIGTMTIVPETPGS